MKAIITVLGRDRVGIIAEVCAFLSARQINILDISQTIVQGFFNMIMIVDMGEEAAAQFEQTARDLRQLGLQSGLEIKLQHEEIFNSMHRI
ncbi:MAG: ACT domain-containing protein [Oscillospiraceae bacterium]|jgi:ACT domain-containing protein|nr:ACT domain-containing protein [Oscillospiraceae bacterium]